jgi:hypothetical protein
MKTKQILLLIVLVGAVGIGGLVMHKKQGAAWSSGAGEGGKLIPNLPVGEAIAKITLKEGTNAITLAKQDDKWRVEERGGYPANYSEISSAVLKLRDLKPVQTEQVGESQLGRLQLLPPGAGSNTATSVEFRDAGGKVLTSILLGKTQMREDAQMSQFGGGGGYPAGRWVMVDGAKDKVALVSDPLSNLKAEAGSWLNKDFIKVEKIRSVTVTYPEATNSWSVSRTNETGSDWTLAGAKAGEALDSSKTSGFGWALSSPSFNDVATSVPDSLAAEQATVIKLETFDGFTYSFKVGQDSDGNRPLSFVVTADLPKERKGAGNETAEDKTRLDKEFSDAQKKLSDKLTAEKALEKWTYWVPGYTLDSLLKKRGELLQTKTEEPSATGETVGAPDAPNFLPDASQ